MFIILINKGSLINIKKKSTTKSNRKVIAWFLSIPWNKDGLIKEKLLRAISSWKKLLILISYTTPLDYRMQVVLPWTEHVLTVFDYACFVLILFSGVKQAFKKLDLFEKSN